MPGDMLTARQAADRLGVRLQTLYAYVSRGQLARSPAPDGRQSRFSIDEVERLAERGRPHGGGRRRGALDVALTTALTTVRDGRLWYRGVDAIMASRRWTFEQAAHWLWSPEVGASQPPPSHWPSVPATGAVAARAHELISPAASPSSWLATVVAALRADDAQLAGLATANVQRIGQRLLAAVIDASALVSGRVVAPSDAGMARRLWPALTGRRPRRELVGVVDVALVLLAEHELASSSLAVRVAASTRADPYAAVLAGLAVLSGPLHGGVAPLVQRAFAEASRAEPPAVVLARLGHGSGEGLVYPGFGHPLYPEGDPRAAELLDRLRTVAPSRAVAVIDGALAEIRHRSGAEPNVDYALGAMGYALGFDLHAPELLFATARMAGWVAHALEEYGERPLRFRTQALYVGPPLS